MFAAARIYARRLAGVTAGRAVAVIGTAVGIRLLTELVEPAVFGEYRLAVAGVGLVVMVAVAPFVHFAMRGFHDAEVAGHEEGFLGSARLAINSLALGGAAVAVATGLVAAVVFERIDLVVLGVVTGGVVVSEARYLFESNMLITRGEVVSSAVFDGIRAFAVPLAAAGVVGVIGASSGGLLLGQSLMGLIIVALVSRRVGKALRSRSVKPWLRSGLRFAAPLIAVGALSWLFSFSDRYLIGLLRSTEEVGVYAAAYGLAATPLAVIGGLLPTLAAAPLFRAAAASDPNRKPMANRLLGAQFSLIAMAVSGIITLSPVAVRLLLAEAFRQGAVQIIVWVAIGQGFQVLSYAIDVQAIASSRTMRIASAYAVAVVVNLGLNLWWIPDQGGLGAARATAAAGFAYFTVMYVLATRGHGDAP